MKAIYRIPAALLGPAVMALTIAASAQDIVLIANKGVSVSQVTEAQVRDIFTGVRSRFGDGSRAVPVVLKGGPVHEVFLRKHVGESPDEFRVRWRKAVFTGQGAMLKEFGSEADLLQYVSATPGAIGYVSRVLDGGAVKVLAISSEK
jgi:ABC-type phosphate transport system substrate-binding protein